MMPRKYHSMNMKVARFKKLVGVQFFWVARFFPYLNKFITFILSNDTHGGFALDEGNKKSFSLDQVA